MILSCVFIAIVGVVAFFHYVQGFFSAFISVVLTLVAAAVALGFHEQFVFLAGGKTGDFATSLSLCVSFALVYFILRLVFDWFIPGNVNFGVLPDKVGAGVMGIIAGMMVAGILALAAGAMPFQPAMWGYSPWPSQKVQVSLNSVPSWARYGRGQDITGNLYLHDWMQDPSVDDAKASSLMLPVEKFAQGYISMVSAGSLEGDLKWSDRHPNYSYELARQRIGLQPNAAHTAFPTKGKAIEVAAIFRGPPGMKQVDGDIKEYRVSAPDVAAQLTAEKGALLIVRVIFGGDAPEKDGKVRFSTSSFRIVAGPAGAKKNFLPVATVFNGQTAVAQRPDDFLVVGGGKGVDLVFDVDPEFVIVGDGADAKIAPGTFIEFKRYSWVDLSGNEVKPPGTLHADERTADEVLRRANWAPRAPRNP